MLHLGCNAFGDDGAMHLAQCLYNIVELKLIQCNIGAKGVELLSEGIMQRKQPVNNRLFFH